MEFLGSLLSIDVKILELQKHWVHKCRNLQGLFCTKANHRMSLAELNFWRLIGCSVLRSGCFVFCKAARSGTSTFFVQCVVYPCVSWALEASRGSCMRFLSLHSFVLLFRMKGVCHAWGLQSFIRCSPPSL